MPRDKKAASVTSWPRSAPCHAATEQHASPQLVNCGGTGRHMCLFPINPFLNYRAEGKCRTASARISPNEPPSFLSPACCLLISSPVWSLFCTAPVSVSLVLFHASANEILGKLSKRCKTEKANYVHFLSAWLTWINIFIYFRLQAERAQAFAHIWSQSGHATKTIVIPGSDSMYDIYFGSVGCLLHANAFASVTS